MQRILVLMALGATLAGCTAYRVEVQQGNIVSEERLALVKPGMEQQQVRFVLGSPLIVDAFHPERWEYFYSLQKEGELQVTYRLTLRFENGKLANIEKQGELPATERAALEMVSHRDAPVRREK
jgi:outer membrane protein assembly factor BamE